MRRPGEAIAMACGLALVLLVVAAGCWQTQPIPPAPAPSPAVSTPLTETAAEPPVEAEPVPQGQADEHAGDGGSAPAAVVEEAPPTCATERIVLLAPASPLIVDLQLSIDGQPHTAALARLVEEVLKVADTDGDGRVTWKDLCANRKIKYGQFGNLAIEDASGEKQVSERYDIDRDGLVDAQELPRFLTRNAGGSRPFSVRGTLDYRDLNRRGAATWRLLDANGDGVLSLAEQAAAPSRLASRDSNDDEIVLPSDLDPRLQTPDPEMAREGRRRGPDAVRLLGPHAEWSSVQLALEQAYGGSRYLRAGSFPLVPNLFAQLDANSDGRISRDEFPRLNDVPPHLVVGVEFGKQGTGDRGQETGEGVAREGEASAEPSSSNPRLRLVRLAPELAASGEHVVEQPGRLTLKLAGIVLTFYTNDTVAAEDFAARARQALEMFDGDKNGYLEKSEVPEGLQAQFGRFEAVDADEDGRVYAGEIEAYLAQQQAGLRAQIHAKAGDREDALFAALDTDHDERLDSREVEGAAQRLAALDADGDDQILPDELPEVLVIGLARGSLENADATFRPPPVIVRGPDEKAPRWFTAMDANRDGVISRREFLGPLEKFAELDADGNGLLEVGEAVSGEWQPPPPATRPPLRISLGCECLTGGVFYEPASGR